MQLLLLKPGIAEMGFHPRLAKMADLTHYAPREPTPNPPTPQSDTLLRKVIIYPQKVSLPPQNRLFIFNNN